MSSLCYGLACCPTRAVVFYLLCYVLASLLATRVKGYVKKKAAMCERSRVPSLCYILFCYLMSAVVRSTCYAMCCLFIVGNHEKPLVDNVEFGSDSRTRGEGRSEGSYRKSDHPGNGVPDQEQKESKSLLAIYIRLDHGSSSRLTPDMAPPPIAEA